MQFVKPLIIFLFGVLATQFLSAQCSAGTEEVIIRVKSNGAWTKLGWVLEDANTGFVYLDMSKLPSNSINILFEDTLCVPTGTELTYRIFDDRGYGLCCEFGDGYYEIEVNRSLLLHKEGFLRPAFNYGFQVPLPQSDLSLSDLNTYDSVAVGLHWVQGKVHNTGQQPITSYTVNWSVNGKGVNQQTYSGFSLAPGLEMDWQHSLGLPADTAGAYDLKVWLSDVNGGVDASQANDSLDRRIVAVVPNRRVLLEARTNFYCGPCGDWMPLLGRRIRNDQQFLFGLIMHSDGWGANDRIYQEYPAQDLRLNSVYPGGTHPFGFVNGDAMSMRFTTRERFWEESRKIRYFSIDKPVVQLDTQTMTLSYQSMVRADLNYTSPNLKLHQVIIEEYIPLPLQPNGEDHAEYVMKQILPDYNGTNMPASILAGDSIPVSNSWILDNVYDAGELGVLIFIQDMTNKEILQVNYAQLVQPDRPSDNATRIEPHSLLEASVGPVPSKDWVEVTFELEKADRLVAEVLSLNGQRMQVLSSDLVPAGPQSLRFDLRALPAGTYILRLITGEQGAMAEKIQKF